MAQQFQRTKTNWSDCYQMAVQGTLWLAKRYSWTLNSIFLRGTRTEFWRILKFRYYEGHPESKERLRIQSAHLFCCSRSLVSGVRCDVEKLPHAVIRRIFQRGKCRDSCGLGGADSESRRDCEMWGVIRFLQADDILGYLTEEASSRMTLLHCTTMHVRILPGRHKPCCVSNSIETSSSILRTVRTWYCRTSSCFHKWRSPLLINASQMMTWRMLSSSTWYEEGIHKLVPRYDKYLNVKGDCVKY